MNSYYTYKYHTIGVVHPSSKFFLCQNFLPSICNTLILGAKHRDAGNYFDALYSNSSTTTSKNGGTERERKTNETF